MQDQRNGNNHQRNGFSMQRTIKDTSVAASVYALVVMFVAVGALLHDEIIDRFTTEVGPTSEVGTTLPLIKAGRLSLAGDLITPIYCGFFQSGRNLLNPETFLGTTGGLSLSIS